MSNADILAGAIQEAPHSYRVIRARTKLDLSDAQFLALVQANPDRFASVQFAKKDKAGNSIKPGRPGVKLIAHLPSLSALAAEAACVVRKRL